MNPAKLGVDHLMKEYGYSREHAEQEVARANCDHEFGDMCMASFMGCVRTCTKCGQMQGLGRHCWEKKS